MKYKKLFWLFSPILLTPFLVACTSPSQIKKKQNYLRNYNYPNQYANGILPIFENKKVQNDIEKALFAPLLKYNSFDNLIVDKVNNVIAQSSKSHLSFYLAKSIELNFDNKTSLTYTNDNFINNTNRSNQYITNLSSNDITSINHPDLWTNMKKATSIVFEIKDNVYYSKYNGQQTQIKLSAQDLISNLTPQIKQIFENNYGVTLSGKGNLLTIISTKKLADNFIKHELMQNMIFNPFPSLNQGKGNFQDWLYVSKYLPYINRIDSLKLIKNKFSADDKFNQALNTIEEISLKFNPTPLDIETFRIQQLRSFRQNLISEAPFEIFNNIQKEDILSRSRQYGLREFFKNNNLQINQHFFFANSFDPQKSDKFNTDFKNFYFQNNQNAYLFRYYLSRIYSLFARAIYLDNEYYWNSLALPLTQLNNNANEQSNIKTLSDAYTQINQQDIYFYSKNTEKKVNYFDLRNYYFDQNHILDFNKALPNIEFDQIKNELNLIINQYLAGSNQEFIFSVPILDTNSERENTLYQYYVDLLNTISPHLKAKLEQVSQQDLEKNNYFINYQIFEYQDNSLESFIKFIWENPLTNVYLNPQNSFNNYPILSSINFDLQKALQIVKTKDLKSQINLINELNNLIPLPFDPKNVDNSKSLSKIIVQNYYQFPLSSDGIINFEDITI
ncbi:OppA family ABC transporter substrate-binding lipoprotein [Mycoplasma sp. 3686d]|uniref:OppA family ABC transporter substrate-binding lipoprotein n=1 Tax=Mycoplasma sp. 3686d TaxID=2967300 RepID=UPI00211C2D3F|nr:hypothetical protein [Mycoplasma sp. 3686d]UUM24596.1 hypothetical protein NPA12_02750 [Mycoplasma sp. 3686d]